MTTIDEWKEVENCGRVVVAAYESLLGAADQLAEKLSYNEDYVLGHIFPKKADDRRETDKIMQWLDEKQDDLREHMAECRAKKEKCAKRAALMEQLGLTEEQKRLLGIKEEKPL